MEEETKKKLLRPSCDVVFQALFQENKENITQSLILSKGYCIIGQKHIQSNEKVEENTKN